MLPRAYDALFARYAGAVPVPYLRALAQRESGMRADLVMPGGSGSARGLMQVVGVLRSDYNDRHGTTYTPDDLLDPAVSVKICAWLLNQIVKQYAKNFPNVAAMQPNWGSRDYVALVTAGWNAGYSRGGGVQRVVAYLVAHGIPVTHASVFRYAAQAGAVRWLQMDERRRWQQSVAALYLEQPDRSGGLISMLLSGFILWGGYVALSRR